ncbi:MAG: hypothetical protein OXC08_20700 [Thiotrichales bacterium]|nr:hypothetical protein [Thiotrichales bacterium]
MIERFNMRGGSIQIAVVNPHRHDGIAVQVILPVEMNGMLKLTVGEAERFVDAVQAAAARAGPSHKRKDPF